MAKPEVRAAAARAGPRQRGEGRVAGDLLRHPRRRRGLRRAPRARSGVRPGEVVSTARRGARRATRASTASRSGSGAGLGRRRAGAALRRPDRARTRARVVVGTRRRRPRATRFGVEEATLGRRRAAGRARSRVTRPGPAPARGRGGTVAARGGRRARCALARPVRGRRARAGRGLLRRRRGGGRWTDRLTRAAAGASRSSRSAAA